MLHVPIGANNFQLTEPSWGTTRPASANGTSVTPAVGSKGSYAALGSAISQDAFGILVNVNTNFASTASRNTVVDIGMDPAGGSSYSVVIPDLLCGGSSAYTRNGGGNWYYFPLFIKAGTTIAARAQGSVTSAIRVGCVTFSLPGNASMVRKGSFIEALGISAPGGTSITPGTTSDGSWVDLGTTSNRMWWWQFGMQVGTADTSWNLNAIHVDVATGDASNKEIIIQDANFCTDSGEYVGNPPLTAGVEWEVPAGAHIYIRAQASGTLETAYNAAVYGLGG